MLNSLQTRLLISYIVLIALVLVAVTTSLLVLLRPLTEVSALDGLSALAHTQTAVLDELAPEGTLALEYATRFASNTARRTQTRVLLLDAQGIVVYDTETGNPLDIELSKHWNVTFDRDGLLGGSFDTPDGPGRRPTAWDFVVAPWPVQTPTVTQIVYARPAPRFPVMNVLRDRFIPQITSAGLIALVLAGLFAYGITRSVTNAVRAVANGAHAVACGDYGHTVPVAGPTEVRELAEAFNTMSRRVRASQQAQRDFVANVSHELRTPLTSIQGFSQAILDGAAGDASGVEHAAQVIHGEAQRLRRLAEDLLELARLDAGQITLRREKVAPSTLLSACAQRLTLRAQEAQVTLALALPPDLPTLLGDGDRLAQVFINLLDNALTHTPAGGQITLSAVAAPKYLDISVRDNGKGIPPDDLARIFERFYQVDKSRKRASGGAGLGLAITREIVLMHGGTISAENAPEGGALFRVRLPLA